MKVTKEYLKEVIKEELQRINEEQEMEESFLTKARQTVFGKNKKEKVMDALEGSSAYQNLIKMGKKGSLTASQKQAWDKAVQAGKWDKYTPAISDKALFDKELRAELTKAWLEALQNTYEESQKTIKYKNADEKTKRAADEKERQFQASQKEKDDLKKKWSDQEDRLAKSGFKGANLSPEQSLELAREKEQRERDRPGTRSDTLTGHERSKKGTHEFSR